MGDDRHSDMRLSRFNIKEGLRRIALFVGLIGLVFGVRYSYRQFGALKYKREQRQEFQRLLSLKATQRIISDHSNAVSPGERHLVPFDEIDSTEVKEVHFGRDNQVEYIQTSDWSRYFSDAGPSLGAYALFFLAPAIGFLVPWGIVKMLAWVASGFTFHP